jgi:glycosyltransferase involved in cell wall biosynthesis
MFNEVIAPNHGPLKVLHVVTDLSEDQGYGGPASNCIGHSHHLAGTVASQLTLFSTFVGSAMNIHQEAYEHENILIVKAHRFASSNHKFVLQFSFESILKLFIEVRRHDIVHVHYAREVIPALAAIFSRILRKKLFLQTHGMIEKPNSALKRLWDFIFTKPSLKNCRAIFYLTAREKRTFQEFFPTKSELIYIPNGISKFPLSRIEQPKAQPEILFMARINERKQPLKFVDIASEVIRILPFASVSMFGPGERNEIDKLLVRLKKENLSNWYHGSIPNSEALEIIAGANLLILPSKDEPFPISVLEALVRGVPCLIGKDCAIAELISAFDSDFVVADDLNSWIENAVKLIKRYSNYERRLELAEFANSIFDYDIILDKCMKAYLE